MVNEQVLSDSHLAEERHELMCSVLGKDLAQGDGLRIPRGIVHSHQYVLVATGRLWEWPYKVHTQLLEWDPSDGQGKERCLGQLIWGCFLMLGTSLADVVYLCLASGSSPESSPRYSGIPDYHLAGGYGPGA